MAQLTGNYETVAVFSVKNGEETENALIEKFKSLIEANGTITNVEDWGKKKLAYEINYEGEGHYWFAEFTSKPDFPAELTRIYGITDGVLRSIVTKKVAK